MIDTNPDENISMFQYWWNKFVERGVMLFDYMIHNYDTMIDRERLIIKHFDIVYGMYWLIDYVDDIKVAYSKDIQQQLIPWIDREFQSGELFKYIHWKPFRDSYYKSESLFGYRKMFCFKDYWFQLLLDWGCQNTQCNYCDTGDHYPNFNLALYGWKKETDSELQPQSVFTIPDDCRIPESFWMHEL